MRTLGLALLFAVGAMACATKAHAIPGFLTEWQAIYPDSNADDIACQLCHVSPGGNQPWNAYGWRIRGVYRNNGFDINEAIRLARDIDSDADPSGASSGDEIMYHYQPGWTVGANNTIYGVDGVPVRNQMPPALLGSTTKLDPAVPVDNPAPELVRVGDLGVALQTVASGFVAPVFATPAPGIPGYLFVVEQTGQIWKVNLDTGAKVLFLDVSSNGLDQLVNLNPGYDERGLLGLAFDPDFINNGYFYTFQSEPVSALEVVDYSTLPMGESGSHKTVISEWFSSDPMSDSGVSNTRRILLTVEQPQRNHNGGMLAFGPDGYLYISLGDGGSADDIGTGHGMAGNGRDNSNPLGSILRIQPRGSNSPNGRYGIPATNPFTTTAGLDEIFAYGFRNPYRFSFDARCFDAGQSCNTLIAGDVGQGALEEIDEVVAGGNYGWNWKEGSYYFYSGPVASLYGQQRYVSRDAPPNAPVNLVDPIAEYGRNDGRSVTGGYIYRGDELTSLTGRYIFADFYSRLFYLDEGNNILQFSGDDINFFIAGFAQDNSKELYVLGRQTVGSTGISGTLNKIVAADPAPDEICVPIKTTSGNIALICL